MYDRGKTMRGYDASLCRRRSIRKLSTNSGKEIEKTILKNKCVSAILYLDLKPDCRQLETAIQKSKSSSSRKEATALRKGGTAAKKEGTAAKKGGTTAREEATAERKGGTIVRKAERPQRKKARPSGKAARSQRKTIRPYQKTLNWLKKTCGRTNGKYGFKKGSIAEELIKKGLTTGRVMQPAPGISGKIV